jgi:hypothetical protein
MDNQITILDIVVIICLGLYILISLFKRKWNDFLYGSCIGLLILSDIPLIPYIILLLTIILLHTYIERKEKSEIKNESDE